MAGVSVPSRMYNIMSAGKPLLAAADEWSEIGMLVKEEQIGATVCTRGSCAICKRDLGIKG